MKLKHTNYPPSCEVVNNVSVSNVSNDGYSKDNVEHSKALRVCKALSLPPSCEPIVGRIPVHKKD